MNFNEIHNIIGVREDTNQVLLDINQYLFYNHGQFFKFGEGPDGLTATWSRKQASGNLPLMVFMQEVAAILRQKLDIAAHVVP